MVAQRLWASSRIDRKDLLQDSRGNAISHDRGEMRAKLIQLGCRSTIRRPPDTGYDVTTRPALISRKPERHLTEKRRDSPVPVILYAAHTATDVATGLPETVTLYLAGNELSLHRSQQLLGLRQGQAEIGDVIEIARAGDLDDIDTAHLADFPHFHQPQNPSHTRPRR